MLDTLLARALATDGDVHDRFVPFHRRGRSGLATIIGQRKPTTRTARRTATPSGA